MCPEGQGRWRDRVRKVVDRLPAHASDLSCLKSDMQESVDETGWGRWVLRCESGSSDTITSRVGGIVRSEPKKRMKTLRRSHGKVYHG